MKKELLIGLLILIIGINVFFAYRPHFDNPYPILGDEFVHISLANYILEGNLPFKNPYAEYNSPHINLESGFHFLLAILFLIIPGEPIIYYKYFIIIFAIINSLLIFYLVKLYTKNNYIALISTLFFGLIRTTSDFLAHNYFLPLTIGVTLLIIGLILLYKIENNYNKKYLRLIGITLILMGWFYPPTLAFLLIALMPYIYFNSKKLSAILKIEDKKLKLWLILIITIILISGLIFAYTIDRLHFIIFDASWTPVKADLSPIFFFGLIPSILAFFGIVYSIKNKQILILSYLAIISIIQTYLYYTLGVTIFVPFHRLFLFYLVIISILAGIGIMALFNYFKEKGIKKEIIICIILVLIAYQIYYTYQNPLEETPKKILDNSLYQVLKYIESNYPQKVNIATDTTLSLSIYPTIGKNVIATLNSNAGFGPAKKLQDYLEEDCEIKEEYIKDYHQISNSTLLTVTEKPFNCTFYKEVYKNNKYYVYEYLTN